MKKVLKIISFPFMIIFSIIIIALIALTIVAGSLFSIGGYVIFAFNYKSLRNSGYSGYFHKVFFVLIYPFVSSLVKLWKSYLK